ncbi:hypothetical protein CFP65_6745 [Kitasatospora sp. MMS16-BH015]|uniref:DUF7683 domain-containing protein n=1 Tax=Kitasatospora sp. MMS16-BH015 TaxID=2018025 RepID=UPI000CA3488F|nr:hypothetical protein [Kitasatospora sp. MMS16-BH015]AUG81385.1 hypothetical protein CFP65_6745 [Kitasatospora sp. MMS16-BH015]
MAYSRYLHVFKKGESDWLESIPVVETSDEEIGALFGVPPEDACYVYDVLLDHREFFVSRVTRELDFDRFEYQLITYEG